MIHASCDAWKTYKKSIDNERETSTVICFDIFMFKLLDDFLCVRPGVD